MRLFLLLSLSLSLLLANNSSAQKLHVLLDHSHAYIALECQNCGPDNIFGLSLHPNNPKHLPLQKYNNPTSPYHLIPSYLYALALDFLNLLDSPAIVSPFNQNTFQSINNHLYPSTSISLDQDSANNLLTSIKDLQKQFNEGYLQYNPLNMNCFHFVNLIYNLTNPSTPLVNTLLEDEKFQVFNLQGSLNLASIAILYYQGGYTKVLEHWSKDKHLQGKNRLYSNITQEFLNIPKPLTLKDHKEQTAIFTNRNTLQIEEFFNLQIDEQPCSFWLLLEFDISQVLKLNTPYLHTSKTHNLIATGTQTDMIGTRFSHSTTSTYCLQLINDKIQEFTRKAGQKNSLHLHINPTLLNNKDPEAHTPGP